jgi:hypothetical protein
MRIDLSDLDRLEGIAEALARLFWCLVVVAFFAAVLGSAGTGLLVLLLAAASFVARAGLEDFVRARREPEEATLRTDGAPEFAVYRASRRPRRTKSAV